MQFNGSVSVFGVENTVNQLNEQSNLLTKCHQRGIVLPPRWELPEMYRQFVEQLRNTQCPFRIYSERNVVEGLDQLLV